VPLWEPPPHPASSSSPSSRRGAPRRIRGCCQRPC